MDESPQTPQPDQPAPEAKSKQSQLPGAAFALAFAGCVLGIMHFIALGLVFVLIGAVCAVVSLVRGLRPRWVALAAVVVCGVGVPLVLSDWHRLRSRELARRVWCASNLNAIVKGATMHQEANDDGAWPADPKMLIGERSISAGHLQCPSADSGRKMDFFYLAPAEPDPPVGTIIACDLPGNHDGEGRNVVYADSHVEWTTEQGLQLELADPLNTRFAEALKKAEGE